MRCVDKLNFSAFAKILKPYLSDGKNIVDFTEKLFTEITSDPVDSKIGEIDIVKKQDDSVWDSYYSGHRDITRFALKIVKYLDIPKFAAFIQKLGIDAQINLAKDLRPYCKGINDENIAQKTADLFSKIILNAAKSRRQIRKKNIQHTANRDIDALRIDAELGIVIDGLTSLTFSKIQKLKLSSVEVENKIQEQNGLLLQKIYSQVNFFYYRVEELFKQIGNIRGKKFKSIAFKITSKYRELTESDCNDQNYVFGALVDWLQKKFPNVSRESCEIVISFFVQNCEVFDELP